ncbi:MAG: metal-dependent hydrolase [Candidatus Thermoplasmatota archaeon]|nr:metal-dependent hydrolase [Candidatus Thermoplasmatota archaeon]
MFPLGHVGIALGVGFLIMRYLKSSWDPKLFIIILGVASLTPDLIDKPIGPLFGLPFGGRLFAHTLVFAFIVMAVCLVLWLRWSKKGTAVSMWPLLFSLGVWVHLLLDLSLEGMAVLLWPAYGVAFPSGEFSWGHLTASPVAIAGEVVGAIILVYLLVLLLLGRFALAEREDRPDNG